VHNKAFLFIQDLAVIMLVAGFITVLCHRLKQPVVLGYILAGVILGPHTPPFSYIHDENTVNILAELGVIFLMFSLGLEFNLRKLSDVGIAATLTALIEIVFMTYVGYSFARLLNWSQTDAIFLGAMLAISSTTIIIKALDDLGIKRKGFAQLIFGVLIIEDIFAIAILALLSSIAITGSWQPEDMIITISKLCSFLVISLIFGILIIPRLLSYIAKFNSQEMLLVSVLGICFGFCLLVIKLGYSVALGAFISGAIVAESRQLGVIEFLITPLRDMFSAIFFVSVGLLFDPAVFAQYTFPIIGIAIVVIIGKIISCTFGALLAGRDGKTAMHVGMGMAQIGEFSFIIAALGMSLNVTSSFLYPIAVVVSAITTLFTPYLIKYSDHLEKYLVLVVPKPMSKRFETYRAWLQKFKSKNSSAKKSPIFRWTVQVIVNLFIIMGIFFSCAYASRTPWGISLLEMTNQHIHKGIIWTIAMILSLPCIVAVYRKMKALSIMMVESIENKNHHNNFVKLIHQLASELIPIVILASIMLFICALSISILPPFELLIGIFVIILLLIALLYRWFVKVYAQLKNVFLEGLKKDD